jgi:hypothetical protein
MKKSVAVFAACAIAACMLTTSCANSKRIDNRSVTTMAPGYGVIVATFRYVPGESRFPREQVFSDAKYLADRLTALGRESFIVTSGGTWASVGFRVPTHDVAETTKRSLEARGRLDLGDGRTLDVSHVEVANIAELKRYALDEVP